MSRNKDGRFAKESVDTVVVCPCGAQFTTNSIKIADGRGKYCSKACFFSYRGVKSGLDHHNWKGDRSVDYTTIHQWVYRLLGKPSHCEERGTTTGKRFEWANLSGEYKRDLSDWKRLCSPCHHKLDKIAERGWETRRKNKCLV